MDVNFNVDLLDITQAGQINNSTKTVSMNEAGIDILITDTMHLAMVINDYLNKIIDVMESTKETYQCEAADELRAKFTELSSDFPIVVQNIENYAYSLKKVRDNFNNRLCEAELKLAQATANIQENINN